MFYLKKNYKSNQVIEQNDFTYKKMSWQLRKKSLYI